MKTIEQIKNEIAIKYGWSHWGHIGKLDSIVNEAIKEHSKQMCDEQIKECSKMPNGTYFNPLGTDVTEYVIQSILNTPNVVKP